MPLRIKNKVVITVKDYYEQRLGKNWKMIDRLENENLCLMEENNTLREQISTLQREKSVLNGKLKATNNMMRILTKTKEDASISKTPITINVSDVDCLLRKKLNDPTDGTKNRKNPQAKLLPLKVVQKKEGKKTVMPVVKQNVSCVKKTLPKNTQKQTQVPSLPPTKSIRILPKKPSPKKPVILFKGKGNLGSDSATRRITKAEAAVGKIGQKNILINKSMTKYMANQKIAIDEIGKNHNQTFILNCQAHL